MSELPVGWVEATLGDLGTWSSGGTPSRKNPENYDGEVPWVKTGELKEELILSTSETISEVGLASSSAKLFPAGTLLVAMYGANIGQTAVLGIPAATNQACAAFLAEGPSKDIVPYVWRYIQSVRTDLVRLGQGGAQKNISQQLLKRVDIPVAPEPEQKRIVAKIDSLTAKSARARTELAKVEALVERYKAAVLEQEFCDLVESSPIIELGDLCSKVTKGSSPKWQGFDYVEDGVTFVRSQNVLWGELDLSDVAFLDAGFNEKQSNSVMETDDVLLNIVGASIGRSAVVPSSLAGANCNQAVAVIRLKPEFIAGADYLSTWLMSPGSQAQINANVVEVARANFSLGQIKKLKLPWPNATQRAKTVRRLHEAFARCTSILNENRRAMAMTDNLDQAALKKAFSGELVLQSPADEPAKELLARIKTVRDNAPKKTRQRRQGGKTKVSPIQKLNEALASWPEDGLTFDELRENLPGSYEVQKDAIFDLLSADPPKLRQEFDENDQTMKLKKV